MTMETTMTLATTVPSTVANRSGMTRPDPNFVDEGEECGHP